MLLWHGPETLIAIKELTSEPGCGQQIEHYDVNQDGFEFLSYLVRQFSGMIGIELDTNPTAIDYPLDKINGEDWSQLRVARGRVVVWEAGKWVHAGSNYNVFNRRIFFSVGSPRFPMSENVEILVEGN